MASGETASSETGGRPNDELISASFRQVPAWSRALTGRLRPVGADGALQTVGDVVPAVAERQFEVVVVGDLDDEQLLARPGVDAEQGGADQEAEGAEDGHRFVEHRQDVQERLQRREHPAETESAGRREIDALDHPVEADDLTGGQEHAADDEGLDGGRDDRRLAASGPVDVVDVGPVDVLEVRPVALGRERQHAMARHDDAARADVDSTLDRLAVVEQVVDPVEPLRHTRPCARAGLKPRNESLEATALAVEPVLFTTAPIAVDVKVVFHHSNDDPDLHERVVGNVANLLDDESVDLDAVALVANSGGMNLLLDDSPQCEQVEALQRRGVRFKQCRNTIEGTDVTEADLVDGVELVSSGVGELARLQSDGYAYVRP